MFRTTDPTERDADNWKDRWFNPPYGHHERCKSLDYWAAGKMTKGTQPRKLGDDWLLENALPFIKDYEAMILEHCRPKWRRAALGTDQSTAAVLSSEYKFDPSSRRAADQKENSLLHGFHDQYISALLYYCKEILDVTLLQRMVRLKDLKDEADITWKTATDLITRYMKKTDARFLLQEIVCSKRREGENLLDWVQRFISFRAQLKGVNVTMPETLWLEWTWAQVSPMERRFIGTCDSLDTLERKVGNSNPDDLPRYRTSFCSKEVNRLPSKHLKKHNPNTSKSQRQPWRHT